MLNKLSNFNNIASGLLIGITAALKPTFILIFIPFTIYRKYSFLLGGIIGLSFSLFLSLTVVNIFIWKKYVLAMLGLTGFIDQEKYLAIKETAIANIIYPQTVEGLKFTQNPLVYRNFSDSSAYKILNALEIPSIREILVLGFITTIVFLSVYLIKNSFQKKDTHFIFLFGILISLIADFFVPIGRYSYYDVQLMVPLFIIITKADIDRLIYNKAIAILLFGLLLSIGCFNWIPKFLTLSTYLITFYITVTSLALLKQQNRIND